MKKFLVLLALMMATVSMATVHTVNIGGISFSPANVTIQQGDTVRWIKPAGGFHNVVESNNVPPVFTSGDPTSSAFTYNFAFAAPLSGTYNYECVVHAGSGMVGTVTVEAGGTAPEEPRNPIPGDGSTGMPTLGFLIWEGDGWDSNIVRFGTTNPPPVVNGSFMGQMFSYSGLSESTTYFWQITAVNTFGQTDGPIWSFTTAGPPVQASNPFPAHSATNVPVNTILGWDAADGATSYEIFFGTTQPLPSIGVTTETTIDPTGVLDSNRTYLWRVNSINDVGTTTGQTWSFTTVVPNGITDPRTPISYQVVQAYPNPFNSTVRIDLTVPQSSFARVKVFDISGREVATLIEGRLNAGLHLLEWNAGNNAAGIYFLRFHSGDVNLTKKLVFLP